LVPSAPRRAPRSSVTKSAGASASGPRFFSHQRGRDRGWQCWKPNCWCEGGMNWKNQLSKLRPGPGEARDVRVSDNPISDNPTCERLARAFSRLQDIQLVRDFQRDRRLEKTTEDRLIWRELLDLELQEADEKMERLCAAAGGVLG